MSKTTGQKTDQAENTIIAQIDRAQAQARTGKTPAMPDLEGHKQECLNTVNAEHRKYSPGNPTKTR